MHKLEKLILESYAQLLTEMDGGRLFDYFKSKGYDITERRPDGYPPKEGVEGYIVSRGRDRYPQSVIFQHNKDTDEFTISRMSGYRIDQKEAIKAGMRQAGRSGAAGMDSYMTDGNYTPVDISAEGLKDIVDHVMSGLDRESKAQSDFYKDRGHTSGTVDEMAKADMEKEAGGRVIQWEELTDKQRAGIVKRYGEPMFNGEHDFFSRNMETYFKTYSKNKETGSIGHKIIKLPSFGSLYKNFSDIIGDIKKLMGSDDVRTDEAAREFFDLTKTNFRKLQRYLRTERPEQYRMLKMQRMMEAIDASFSKIEEKMDMNDPVMIKVRRAKMHSDQMKKLDAYIKSPEGKAASRAQASAERKEIKAREIVRKLKIKRAQVMSDMENDPQIEPTGGPVADMYGDQLNKIDNAIEKAASLYNKNMSYDQAVGKINEFVGDAWVKRNEPLYDKLVKGSGKSDTVEGEILRAVNRIIYRWGNDGDYFWKGYGAETAGPAVSYLVNSSMIPQIIQSKFKAWVSNNDGEDYDIKELEDLLAIALEYIESKDESEYSKNTEDMFDYESEYEDEEEDYDDYDDYDEEEDDDYYQEGKGQKISKSNMDGYKKGNLSLAESLLDDIKEEEEPEPEEEADEEAPKETVLEDATDQILGKFPTLQAAIIKLQTEDFKEFVDSIDWISPRPTEFRINLKNGQDYIMKWTGTGFEAQIMGKRFYIDKITDYQQALDKLAILYKEGPMAGAGEGEPADVDSGSSSGGGGGDFPGDDTGGGGGDDVADLGGDDAGDAGGGADLTGEPVDFEEPAEEPEA